MSDKPRVELVPLEDLASLFVRQPSPALRYGQGRILTWDAETFENTVEWRGATHQVVLKNLPVLAGIVALSFKPGQTVALIGWDAEGSQGFGVWWILGRLVIPGDQVDSEVQFDVLSANTINADALNAERINVEGQTVDESVEESAPPPVGTIKVTYGTSWSANYKGNNARNTFNSKPHQGFWSSTNGNQRSLIGFPSSTIQSDHGGRTITRVRVYLYFAHWNFNSGGTAIIGHHGHNSAPSSFSATTDVQRSGSWPKPGGRWVTYTHTPSQWASGAKRGIALGPGPSTSKVYYGRARGHGESKSPRLEITSTA